MKKCSAALLNRLNNSLSLCMVELFVIKLTNGAVFRFTSLPYTFKCGNYNYTPLAVNSGELKQSLGISVDDFTMEIYYSSDDKIKVNNAEFTFPHAMRAGAFDFARCEYYQVFLESWVLSESEDYRILLFAGRMETQTAGRSMSEIKVVSFTSILNTKSPPNVYQAGCVNSLYGYCCGLNDDAWKVGCVIQSGSTKNVLYVDIGDYANGYFQSGYVKFLNGINYGVQRTIKSHAYNQSTGIHAIELSWKLDNFPSVGDSIYLVPGCDHSKNTCIYKFNNGSRYRGTPFIPIPTTGNG